MKNVFWFSVLSGLLSTAVHAAGEIDFLGSAESVRSERTIQTGNRAQWILPFETTQYIPAQQTPIMRDAIEAQQSGRFIEAIGLLEQPGEEVDLPDTQLLRASFYIQGDQPGQAQDILGKLLQSHPELAEAHALMGMAHLLQGQIDPAWNAVQKAQRLGGGPLVMRITTYVLQAQGKVGQASDVMAALNAKGPADALNLAREAELALSLGENQRASTRAMHARELAPKSPYVMAVVGLVRLIEDKPAEAQRAFEIALKRDPEDAKSLLGLGLAKARQGKLEESLTVLRKAAQSDPSSGAIQTYLGRALYQSGHLQEAQAAYRKAIKLDPQDPAPWIYLAQSQNESGQPGAALESLKEASARKTARAVYRGENLLNEDEQTLQANLADTYRSLGMNEMAWLTLTDGAGEKNAVTLKNQAEVLHGKQHAENARRSLSLQSLFNDSLDALPVTLDVYGDGAGQTGAQTPQHGAVEGLSGQQASYGDYGALFGSPAHVELDGIMGNRLTWGEQVRAAIGGGQFGISVAHRYYETEGFSSFNDLANTVWETILKWDPTDTTRIFVSYRDYNSDRGEIFYPNIWDTMTNIHDDSWTGRVGLSQKLGNGGEIRALVSRQHTDQQVEYVYPWPGTQPGNSKADSGELQYRQNNRLGLFVAGIQDYQEKIKFPGAVYCGEEVPAGDLEGEDKSKNIYISQKAQLDKNWILDAGFGRVWSKSSYVAQCPDDPYPWSFEVKAWTPKLGLTYSPSSATHVRLAFGQDVGMREVGSASLAPVETSGIVNLRPSDLDKEVKFAGLGLDHRFAADWMFSSEAQIRKLKDQNSFRFDHREAEAKLGWLPATSRLNASVGAGYEMRKNLDYSFELDSIYKQRLRNLKLTASWLLDSKLTLKGEVSRNWVDGDYLYVGPFNDTSTQVNASVQWKLPLGQIELGVRNLLDSDFEYTESDPLAPRFSKGRLVFGTARMSF